MPPDRLATTGRPAIVVGLPEVEERRWLILGVLVLSLVIVMTANSSLNLAIPSLVRDTGATAAELQWIVDAYALSFAGFLMTAGAVGDRFGRKGALIAGLVLFGGMSLLATTADRPIALVAIRAVQGLGAALIMPGTLSILTAVFPAQERARAIAIWTGFAASGAAVGILGSGWLLEHFWWGSVFLVNVPVVGAALLLVGALVPTSRDPRTLPLDWIGAVLSIASLGGLLFGIIEGPERGWDDPLTLTAFAVGAVALAAFLQWERRTTHPMLELRLFSNPAFSIGTATISLTFFAMFGMWFLMTQYLQSVRSYTPLEAGVRTLPLVVALMVATPRSALLTERFGRRAVLSAGLLLMSAALLVMTALETSTSYLVLAGGLVVLGVGMGNVGAPATAAVMAALPVSKAGVGSAVNDTAREVGGALGIAVLGTLLSSGYRANLGDATEQLTSRGATVVAHSIGGTLQEAARVGGADGARLADLARDAYVDAMSVTLAVAAVTLLGGIAVVHRWLPPPGTEAVRGHTSARRVDHRTQAPDATETGPHEERKPD